MNKRRKTVAAIVSIIYLLAVLVVPSFAYVSYNAAASIFWKSGIQGLYMATNSNFFNMASSIFQVPESSLTSSNGVYFDTQFLSNYRDKHVDDGEFHFAYEQLNFYQNSPTTTFIYPLDSLYTYLVFDRILYVEPGETVQFFVVPLSNRWKVTYDGGNTYSWYYFNLLTEVNFGRYDPMANLTQNQFTPDSVLTYDVSVVAATVYNNNLPRNVYQIMAKNNSDSTVTCDGLRFSFAPSNQNTNAPTNYPNFNVSGDIDALGLLDYFSNVIKWYESPETDVILNELAQIRAQNNRIIEIDEEISSGISDVNNGIQEIVDIWSETADYSDVTAPPEYDPNIPESQAVDRWDNYIDDAEEVLGHNDLRSSATFWQRTITYLISLPGALTISGLFAALLGLRAVLGR